MDVLATELSQTAGQRALGNTGTKADWKFLAFIALAVAFVLAHFLARGHLAVQISEECLGGIAVEVLAHGIRFPLAVYAQNNYDNGYFFSGLLTAGAFQLLGRRVFALMVEPYVASVIGAVAVLSLLRGCLSEIGVTDRRVGSTAMAAAVIALVLGTQAVVFFQLRTLGMGSHPEGGAIAALLMASFPLRSRKSSALRMAAFWAFVGLAMYLNKGLLSLIPALAVTQRRIARERPTYGAESLIGFLIGASPQWLSDWRYGAIAWKELLWKATPGHESQRAFLRPFIEGAVILADRRIELLAAWTLSIIVAALWLRRVVRGARVAAGSASASANDAQGDKGFPATLALVLAHAGIILSVFTVMGPDPIYFMDLWPAIVVLFGVSSAALVEWGLARMSGRPQPFVIAAVLLMTVLLYRPEGVHWSLGPVDEMWRNSASAACSYRFADGFLREKLRGTRGPRCEADDNVQFALDGCRSLPGRDQVLDCIGGLAAPCDNRIPETLARLQPDERRALAYYVGLGTQQCDIFGDAPLQDVCRGAVKLKCLVSLDFLNRALESRPLGRPRCSIAEPPMAAYWAGMRADILGRLPLSSEDSSVPPASGPPDLLDRNCIPAIEECLGTTPARFVEPSSEQP